MTDKLIYRVDATTIITYDEYTKRLAVYVTQTDHFGASYKERKNAVNLHSKPEDISKVLEPDQLQKFLADAIKGSQNND